jgi:hypothetical protein
MEETTREICRVVTRIWVEGVHLGMDARVKPSDSAKLEPDAAPALLKSWKAQIDSLMSRLDWGVWLKCRPACSYEVGCVQCTRGCELTHTLRKCVTSQPGRSSCADLMPLAQDLVDQLRRRQVHRQTIKGSTPPMTQHTWILCHDACVAWSHMRWTMNTHCSPRMLFPLHLSICLFISYP